MRREHFEADVDGGFSPPFADSSSVSSKSLAVDQTMVQYLDLQSFIIRSRVLKLYRQALRITRKAPTNARGELKEVIRKEIEENRQCDDKQKIRFLISEGIQRLKSLDEMLDMMGHS